MAQSNIPPLVINVPIVDPEKGTPTPGFAQIWQQLFGNVTTNVLSILSKADKTTTLTAGAGLTGGGNLSANRSLSLANTAVTPGTYGTATKVAQVTVDAQGRLTNVAEVTITAGGGSGDFNPPLAANFTDTTILASPTRWDDNTTAGLGITAAATGSSATNSLRGKMKAITGTTWVCRIRHNKLNQDYVSVGLVLGNGSNTKMVTCELVSITGSVNFQLGNYATNSSVVTAVVRTAGFGDNFITQYTWLKIYDDGTNLNFYVSIDGAVWISVGSQGRTSYMGVAPSKVGFFINNATSSALSELGASVSYWKES